MGMSVRKTRVRTICAVIGAVMATGPLSTVVAGNGAGAGFVLPAGPAKPGFDVSRFTSVAYGIFETFHVERTELLRDALEAGRVAGDTNLLVTETAAGPLALLVEQMAFHHIAQGTAKGQPWLVSFCVVCNTGTRLTPRVDGQVPQFETAGAYDGLLVMQDTRTRTLWNHITGDALYGPGVGRTLGPAGNVLQRNVSQALSAHPAVRVAISDRFYFAAGKVHGRTQGFAIGSPADAEAFARMYREKVAGPGAPQSTNTAPNPDATLSAIFEATLGQEDGRRPRMDLGLGVWTAATRRYYPLDLIRRSGALLDEIDGRTLLVYVDPATFTPAAVYVTASAARLDGGSVLLDGGRQVKAGVLWDRNGRRLTTDRPAQLFTRWYGFALTFPNTEVFGQE